MPSASRRGTSWPPSPVRPIPASPAPKDAQVSREVALTALGQSLKFAVTEWRSFMFRDPNTKPTPNEPSQITLQGDRPLLHRVTSARPDQQITILAERRPGSSDAFVLTVDLCPR